MTREYTDAERMDWIEAHCFELVWDDTRPGVVEAGFGHTFHGDTRREAIDRALACQNMPEADQPDDDGGSLL